MSRQSPGLIVAAALLCGLASRPTRSNAADWPQFGRDGTRNAVSLERRPPTSWDVGKMSDTNPRQRIGAPSRNIKWTAPVGSETYGDPVVKDGLVWIGTNNTGPNGDASRDGSVLACFRESDGKPLYRYVSPRLPQGKVYDREHSSIRCSPLIDNDRLWFVTNRAEVVCLDIAPLRRDGAEAKLLWKVDLIGQFDVFPFANLMYQFHSCSIAGYRDLIYVITGNGIAATFEPVAKPNAPSLICFNRNTGEAVWQDKSPGENILCTQWTSPTIIEIDGRAQCVAPQGDGWVRSFDALTGELIWKFDMNPKETRWDFKGGIRNEIVASPVFADGRIFIGSGRQPEFGEGQGRLVCLDPTRRGDISSELAVDGAGKIIPHRRVQAVDRAAGEKAIPNPDSGLVWDFTGVGDGKKFEDAMHVTHSNVVVHNGLVIALDVPGNVHCLDARTGKRYWSHDALGGLHASPLIVDDKVYVAKDDQILVFGLSANPEIAMRDLKPLHEIPVEGLAVCAPIFANGVLYVATSGQLFAIASDKEAPHPDWPTFGRDGTRNAVSPERRPPTSWDVGKISDTNPRQRIAPTSRNVKWTAPLGSATYSTPVISGGLAWIGTNNLRPGMKPGSHQDSVLLCFRVADGKQVYEYVSPHPGDFLHDPGWAGLGSSPLVEGDRLWITTNRSEVLCLDIGPLLRDEGPPKEVWKLDLAKTFDTFPFVPVMGPPRPCSIGPSWKGRIFVTINNGISWDRREVPKPNAASLVCLNKDTGEVYWKDNSPGANILMTQFASPTVAEIRGQTQVIVPQSDGWMRAFDPESGEKLWEFDVNPKASVYNDRGGRNSLMGNAVVSEDRVYIASGRDVDQTDGPARLVCIDPTRRGDVSSELAVDPDGKPLPRRRLQAVKPEAGEKAIPNPNSALVWEFVGSGKAFADIMHRTMGSVVVARGLVIAAETNGLVNCFDAKTGQRHWNHDALTTIWGSPLIVDDHVFVADGDGEVLIFGLSPDPDVALRRLPGGSLPLRAIPMGTPLGVSPVFANGVLYLATWNELFAIESDKEGTDADLKTAGYWPQWRGPNRDNVSSEKGLLQEWPEAGPPLLWTATGVGEGIASVSVAEGKIFTFGYQSENEFVVALEERTGELSWAARIGPAVAENRSMRWLTQRAPTVDGERLYTITAAGDLICLSTAGGRELWRTSYPNDFGGKRPIWGFCDWPLVDGDKLICSPGGPQTKIVALDKQTGKVIWKTQIAGAEEGTAGYAALVVAEIGGLRQYVTFLSQGLVGVAADDGRLLWRYDGLAESIHYTHTPLVRDDEIFCSSGYVRQAVLLKVVRDGRNFAVNEIHKRRHNRDPFQDCTALVGDHIYSTDIPGAPVCLNWKSGEAAWGPLRIRPSAGRLAIVAGDGCLYYRSSDGWMTLAQATPEKFVPRGRFAIPGHEESLGATAPVIAGRRLYLRDDNRLLCYDIRTEALNGRAAQPRTIALDVPVAAARASSTALPTAPRDARPPRGIFVPTPHDVVRQMLDLAGVRKTDVVYDLGSGDGRIVIAAAKHYGCKAVGYEIDAELVAMSREQVKADEVEKLVTIEKADVFTVDLTPADVVTLYLLPQQIEKLVPQLQKLKPGSRVVSHQFEIPGIKADRELKVDSAESGEKHTIYLWTTPLKGGSQ